MSSIDEIMSELCKKYGVKPSTVNQLIKAEESKRDLRRRRGLPELLRQIIEDEINSKEAYSAAAES